MTRERPLFSVIIPTYNRPQQLSTCLASLTRLHFRRDRFEVIIVDDGSAMPLEPILASFYDRLHVALLKQPNAGPAAARNTGAARAQGQFLAFTDDDCAPAPDWLQKLEARFAETPNGMVGGRTINALSDNLYSTASQVIVEVAYAYFHANPSPFRFFASNNIALPSALFHAIGGFDVTFRTSEDRELCDRWQRHGYPMIYAPDAVIYHSHALTLCRFWRQHFNYGRGAFRFHRARARRGAGRFKPALKFYLNVLRYPFSQGWGGQAVSLSALFAVWQMANAAGFFWERINHR